MHDNLWQFPNDLFYGGALQSARACADLPAPKGFKWEDEERTAFIHSAERETTKGSSFQNEAEAHIVLLLVLDLLQPCDIEAKDIVILSPYKAQQELIKTTLQQYPALQQIRVASIDSFQGDEGDVVILSTVRSNRKGNIGFLFCNHRVNVAATRARKAFFIVGDYRTLIWGDNECCVWRLLLKRYGYYEKYGKKYYKKMVDAFALYKEWVPESRIEKPSVPANEAHETFAWVPSLKEKKKVSSADLVPIIKRFMKSAKKVTDSDMFKNLLDFLQELKKGGSGEQDNESRQAQQSRKDLSQHGSALFRGISKQKDPTNLVYYIAFQVMMRNTVANNNRDNDLKKRFYDDVLPQEQMIMLLKKKRAKTGVLIDAGDYVEAMLAVTDLQLSAGKYERKLLMQRHRGLIERSFKQMYKDISVLVGDAQALLRFGCAE